MAEMIVIPVGDGIGNVTLGVGKRGRALCLLTNFFYVCLFVSSIFFLWLTQHDTLTPGLFYTLWLILCQFLKTTVALIVSTKKPDDKVRLPYKFTLDQPVFGVT